jgi:hypothetical protein
MMKCFINEKNNKIKSILKGVGEIPRLFSENMLERVYINEHTRKSDERTGTFHGYCNMFLKEEIHRMSFPKTFTIIDKKAELDMIKNVAEDMGISLKDNTAKKIMSEFDVGDIVRHKVFGVGEIIKIDNIMQTYEIQFRNIRGTRRIMFRAELEKVSQPD